MIVIPMAGLSRRFTEAGYKLPKYMLPLHGRSVFAHAVSSFARYFTSQKILFIARNVAGTPDFVADECRQLGIADFQVCVLNRETAGQAETVELGLNEAAANDHASLTIFNIDTFREDFRFPDADWFHTSAGYLEVFRGEGSNWSYVDPDRDSDEPLALRTTEKVPVSNLCCDGLYHFAATADFRFALAQERKTPSMPELYVAPIYNHLIRAGRKIHYEVVPETAITFCGVPVEYEQLKLRRPAAT